MIEAFDGIVKRNSNEAKLLAEIDHSRLPKHIAVIMDGNGRWAKLRGRPRIFGHREGAESVRSILDTSARLGIEALTLYAFSTENWKRPKTEVSALMSMLKRVLKRELSEVHGNNIRFRTIGDVTALSDDVRQQLAAAEKLTAANTGTVMNVALNYGSRAEIVRAANLAAKTGEITEESIEANLYTSGMPQVDLLIRTSGEFRISNFLLWQIAYSEIHVTPTLFPDFRRQQLFEAIVDFQKRDRRYGGLGKGSK